MPPARKPSYEDLEEQVAQLRKELRLDADRRLDRVLIGSLGMTPSEASIVAMLYNAGAEKPVGVERMMVAMFSGRPKDPPTDHILKVHVCRIRKKLHAQLGVAAIRTHYREGWSITKAGQAALSLLGA